jgi:hypothetical protein
MIVTKLRIKEISELNIIRFADDGKQPYVFITAVDELDNKLTVRVYGERKIKECIQYLKSQKRIDLEIELQHPKASKVNSISEWTEDSWKKERCELKTIKPFIKLQHKFDDIVESTLHEAELKCSELMVELTKELKYLNSLNNILVC